MSDTQAEAPKEDWSIAQLSPPYLGACFPSFAWTS